MKILTGIDIAFDPLGGSPIVCNDWYSNLPANTQVKFLALKPKSTKVWWTIKDVQFLQTPKTSNSNNYKKYIEDLQIEVLEIINTFKPNVIHAQHLNFGLSKVFSQIPNIPKLGICHGTDVQWALKQQFFKQNLINITKNLDYLLFPTKNMVQDFFNVYKNKKPYCINPLGIPDSFFELPINKPKFKNNSTLKVLYAGRLLAIKGAHIIVQSLAYTNCPVNLTIIGNEDEANYIDKLKHLIKQYNLEQKVTFKPQVSRLELINLFRYFDLIVFPSVAVEAFCLTAIEAQTQGIPIAYANAGGITNTVENSGFCVLPNTAKQWSLLYEQIFKNPELLQKYQELGLKNARKYKLSNTKQQLFEISKNLINLV